MAEQKKPVANPSIVLREEFDDWAILFDPDSGHAFGLNPVGVFIWKHLDGDHTIEDIYKEIRAKYKDIPHKTKKDIKDFVRNLLEKGLTGYEA
ncbi:MAG: SynChlorMet cassette protein ScmD [bacterium]